MKLTSTSDVQALLASLNFHPSRKLGQNFLIDGNIINLIVSLVRPEKEDIILEIGPGLGAITEPLLQQTQRVIAVEKDHRLCDFLKQRFAFSRSLELIESDALDLDTNDLLAKGVTKVVSNLPYSVGNRILVNIIEARLPPRYILVTVQKEVADRLKAKPGTKDYGLLSIWAQLRYDVVVEKVISPTCFLPPPQIKSAIVELFRLGEPPIVTDAAFFNRLVKLAFSHRRKQLGPTLQKNGVFLSLTDDKVKAVFGMLKIPFEIRPDQLTPPQWAELSNRLTSL